VAKDFGGASPPLSSVETVAFGDLFLEDVRAYREQRLTAAGRRGAFPLWGRDTGELAREFVAAGLQAIVACLDPRALDASFAGRAYEVVEREGFVFCDVLPG
jgi:diphthamide synthase (EF-2-diphthine--ammonia ligase)